MPGRAVLSAGVLLAAVLGSVHAFSVFLEPLEAKFGAGRAEVSLTYSIALIAITAMVTMGGRIYHRAPAWVIVAGLSILGLFGATISAMAPGLPGVWLGYGVLFGAANGIGYGFALQLSAQAWPGREGLAMGVITAAYAVGASAFPLVFGAALERGGFAAAMVVLGAALVLAGTAACWLLWKVHARFQKVDSAAAGEGAGALEISATWLAYGLAVFAGLMAIGHATEIARALGVAAAGVVAAPVVIAVCNMAGSLGGGWLTDRLRPSALMIALALASAVVLLAMGAGSEVPPLAGLGVIGLAYGAVITVTPAMIARRFGVATGVSVYGRVFTAWAVAGLGGPVLAGWMFDRTGGYETALLLAGGLAVLSAVVTVISARLQGQPR